MFWVPSFTTLSFRKEVGLDDDELRTRNIPIRYALDAVRLALMQYEEHVGEKWVAYRGDD